MSIQLSDHFSYFRLFRFVLPSVIMMIFTSIYSVIDGIFVSNFVGETAFAAVNLMMPFLQILGVVGMMFGTGGSALVAKTLGEKRDHDANRYFSNAVFATAFSGIVISLLAFLLISPIARLLGATDNMMAYCVLYSRFIIPGIPLAMLQNLFQPFFITAERPRLGLWIIVAAGCTNIALDALFVAAFRWGLVGAAVATCLGECVGGLLPVFYFLSKRQRSRLKLVQTKIERRALVRSAVNGSSELMTNVSASLVNMLYNFQILRIAGENGVSAFGAIMYVSFIFAAIFFGFALGSSPIVSYHYGAKNHAELNNMLKKCLTVVSWCAVIMTLAAELLSAPLSQIFVGYNSELYEMTRDGFRLYSISYLICGFNIFGSAFFTALNDGLISAILSFVRTLVFQVLCILIMPGLWGLQGIWLSLVAAEALSISVTVFFMVTKRKKYHYA